MSSTSNDRKRTSPGADDVHRAKRKKGGNSGKWQTTHQKAKAMRLAGATVEPGDAGVWVSCTRGMEAKAAGEIQDLFDEYVDKVYGVRAPEGGADSDGQEGGDIEAAIDKELGALKSSGAGAKDGRSFTPTRLNLDCLLFVKTRAPIEPVDFVKTICQGVKEAAASQAGGRRSRYLNRLTPITLTGKVADKGIEETARAVLANWFDLKTEGSAEQAPSSEGDEAVPAGPAGPERPAYSYAIRESIRNNKSLKRDAIIQLIASLIGERHKVNLGSPDKVILVDIYQTLCGMSVVDGDWDDLKRYNLHELASRPRGQTREAED